MIELRINHHAKQREVFGRHNDGARLVIARCGRKFGKSRGTRAPIARGMVEGKRLAYVAPEYKYLTQWTNDFIDIYHCAITRAARHEHVIEFATGAQLDLWSLDNYDAIRPREYDTIVIDECALSPYYEAAWTQAIQPTLIKRKGTAWHLSTPKTDKGGAYFKKLWYEAAGYAQRYHYTSYDNPHLPPEELERYKSQVSTLIYQQEVLADFVDVGGARVKSHWLRYAEPDSTYSYVLGVDPAISEAEGADPTALVIYAMPEDKELPRIVIDAKKFKKTALAEIVREITTFGERYNITKCAIENVAFQRIIVEAVRKEKPQWYVKGMPATKSKLERFLPVEARIEHGEIRLSKGVPEDFVRELTSFTGEAKNESDHYVDALVHADAIANKNTVGIFTI